MSFRVITFARGGGDDDPYWQAAPMGDVANRDEAMAAGERWLAAVRGEAGDGAVVIVNLEKSFGGVEWIATGWLPVGLDEMLAHAATHARGQVGGAPAPSKKFDGARMCFDGKPIRYSLRDGLLRISEQLRRAAGAIDTALAAGEAAGWVEDEA